jgi:hypothetical protein
MKINVGTKLKRKQFDFGIVKIIEIDQENNFITILDKGLKHFIPISKIQEFFSITEDEILLPEIASIDNNMDDSKRHNINTANRPSSMQEFAFNRDKD